MSRYVLDTDTCIFWLNGNKRIERRILAVSLSNIRITVITECELEYGARRSSHVEKNLAVLNDLRKKVRCLHTSPAIAPIYGKIKFHLDREGQKLDDADLLIACMTLGYDAVLVSHNVRHFHRIPGLKLETWK